MMKLYFCSMSKLLNQKEILGKSNRDRIQNKNYLAHFVQIVGTDLLVKKYSAVDTEKEG